MAYQALMTARSDYSNFGSMLASAQENVADTNAQNTETSQFYDSFKAQLEGTGLMEGLPAIPLVAENAYALGKNLYGSFQKGKELIPRVREAAAQLQDIANQAVEVGKGQLDQAVSLAKNTADTLNNQVLDLGNTVTESGQNLLSSAQGVVSNVESVTRGGINDVMHSAQSEASNILQTARETGQNIVSVAQEQGTNAISSLTDVGKQAIDTAMTTGSNVLATAKTAGENVLNSAMGYAEGTINAAKGSLGEAYSKILSVGGEAITGAKTQATNIIAAHKQKLGLIGEQFQNDMQHALATGGPKPVYPETLAEGFPVEVTEARGFLDFLKNTPMENISENVNDIRAKMTSYTNNPNRLTQLENASPEDILKGNKVFEERLAAKQNPFTGKTSGRVLEKPLVIGKDTVISKTANLSEGAKGAMKSLINEENDLQLKMFNTPLIHSPEQHNALEKMGNRIGEIRTQQENLLKSGGVSVDELPDRGRSIVRDMAQNLVESKPPETGVSNISKGYTAYSGKTEGFQSASLTKGRGLASSQANAEATTGEFIGEGREPGDIIHSYATLTQEINPKSVGERFFGKFKNMFSKAPELKTTGFNQPAINSTVETAAKDVTSNISGAVAQTTENVSRTAENITQGAKQAVSNITENVSGGIQSATESGQRVIGGVTNAVENTMSSVTEGGSRLLSEGSQVAENIAGKVGGIGETITGAISGAGSLAAETGEKAVGLLSAAADVAIPVVGEIGMLGLGIYQGIKGFEDLFKHPSQPTLQATPQVANIAQSFQSGI